MFLHEVIMTVLVKERERSNIKNRDLSQGNGFIVIEKFSHRLNFSFQCPQGILVNSVFFLHFFNKTSFAKKLIKNIFLKYPSSEAPLQLDSNL